MNKLVVEYFDGSSVTLAIAGSKVTLNEKSSALELNEAYAALKVAADTVSAVSNAKAIAEQQEMEDAIATMQAPKAIQ